MRAGWKELTGRNELERGSERVFVGETRAAECYLVAAAGILAVWRPVECTNAAWTQVPVNSATEVLDGDVENGGFGHEVAAEVGR